MKKTAPKANAKKRSTDIPLDNIPERKKTHTFYSDEFKLKAVERLKAGDISAEALAKELGVPTGSIIAKWARRIAEGKPISDARGGPRTPKSEASNAMQEVKASLARAHKARDERLEVAALIVENDIGGKEAEHIAKAIRNAKRPPHM